jgi:hypothetical protein
LWTFPNICVLLLSYATLYDEVEDGLKVVQTAALLEIVHAALGIVKSPVMTTVLQGKTGCVVLDCTSRC